MNIGTTIEEWAMRVPLLRRPFYQRDMARAERDTLAAKFAQRAGRVPSAAPIPPDTKIEFRSLEAWLAFRAAHPEISDGATSDRIVAHGGAHGVASAFFGDIGVQDVALAGPSHREQFLARGFNPRQRALLELLQEKIGPRSIYDVSVYAHEALTPMALALRGRYPRCLASEYVANAAEAQRIYPIPGIDITASGLPENSFDVILSGDVLEHVPDLPAALQDSARILKRGGCLLATFPFLYLSQETAIKARLANPPFPDQGIEFLTTPEYHGNPMDPGKGSLVFQLPGWDVLATAKKAGFADTCMLFWSSFERGFTAGPDLSGLLILVATR